LVPPPDFRPVSTTAVTPVPIVAFVWKTEEKGSDVNLGAHLIRDGYLKKYDVAAVLTNDPDLAEPLRIVAEELKLPIVLLTPVSNPANSLTAYAADVRHIGPYLGPANSPIRSWGITESRSQSPQAGKGPVLIPLPECPT
jgi:hypothetical protein